MIRATGAVIVWIAGCLSAVAAPRLQWVTTGERGERVSVEVSGLDATALAAAREWPAEKLRALLGARVLPDAGPAMLGKWQVEAGVLRFTPQFPLTPGVTYRAEFDPAVLPGSGAASRITSDFAMPAAPRGPATVLTQVHPSAEEVPENLLKFYLHFSAPMSRGHIYDHIHLRDERGKDVDLPFLEIDEELWDPGMKRLTLFIDPGRIKREVKPLEDVGPALVAGRRFTLAIDAAWLDAAGHPLARNHERTFRVGPADRKPITPSDWKVTPPARWQRRGIEGRLWRAIGSRPRIAPPPGYPREQPASRGHCLARRRRARLAFHPDRTMARRHLRVARPRHPRRPRREQRRQSLRSRPARTSRTLGVRATGARAFRNQVAGLRNRPPDHLS